ncbi:hypothetical protein [Hyalangium rubrum]|uniref:Uncharacterized protein n=1 Tax=Hyalangium rubrum TaxID=3103134 RepID=A0ABU5HFK4_9BACT|nr:hypothetical protein [Hyalangium sp. s54d21]MDY7231924.1 hypothetical protein [Hyalangium sp. s54d21]
MDAFVVLVFMVTALALWLASAVPYGVLLVLVNLVYRASSGHFFRWFSRATIVPFLLLLPVWIVVAYALWSNYPGPK